MSGLATIIIPVYNGGSVIKDAVSDVFSQDYSTIELIAVNDGSSDDSPAILNELQQSAPEHITMRIIDQANGGICAARNAGLKAAAGEFIAFVDQDDRIPSDYISTLAKAMDSSTNIVIGGTIDLYPASGKETRRDLDTEAPWSMYRNTAPWGRLFRRTLIEKHSITFYDYKLSEDFYFNFLCLSYCRKGEVKIIEQSGYKWRIDEASESHSNMSRIADDRDVTVILGKLLEDMQSIEAGSALEKNLFEYLMIKHVMWYMLYVCKGANKEDTKQVYAKCMTWLKANFPDYRRNPELKAGRPKGEAKKIRSIVRACVTLEKLGLLKTALILY